MKNKWIIGILGLWLIILAYLGIPLSMKKILIIITGLSIFIICFWQGLSGKVEKETQKQNNEEK